MAGNRTVKRLRDGAVVEVIEAAPGLTVSQYATAMKLPHNIVYNAARDAIRARRLSRSKVVFRTKRAN